MGKIGQLGFWFLSVIVHILACRAHEWCKHGTCAAAAVPSLDDELKFFGTVLKIYQQLNFQKLLDSVGIIPSNKTQYKVDQLSSTKNIFLSCSFHIPQTDDFDSAFLSNAGPKVKPLLECEYLEVTHP